MKKDEKENKIKQVKILYVIVFCILLIILFCGLREQNMKRSSEMSKKILKSNVENILLELEYSNRKCHISSERLAKCFAYKMGENITLDKDKIITSDGSVWTFNCGSANNCTITINPLKSEQIIIPFTYNPNSEMYELP